MRDDAEAAEAKRLDEKMRVFIAQAIANLDDVPRSAKNQRLIDDVANGVGLPASFDAHMDENMKSMTKD